MNGITQAFLVGGVLQVVAGVIAWRTWLARRMRVVEVRAKAPGMDSAGLRGPWPVAELERDQGAERYGT